MKRYPVMSVALVLAALMATPLGAQEPQPSPSPREGEVSLERPPAVPVDRTPKQVTIPGPPASRDRDSADAGGLKGLRAVSIQAGEARVVLEGRETTVRPGDRIGSDVVKTIVPGRIVLDRPGTASQPQALVVVTFDAQGRSRVAVYSTRDTTARVPPEVK